MKTSRNRILSRLLSLICLSLLEAFLTHTYVYAGNIAEREVLPNGMVLLHAPKKALPIVKIVMAIKAGSVSEPAEKAGLAYLTADLLNEGTLKRSSQEISEEIEFVGGELTTSGGADYSTVTLSILKKDIELGFGLLSDIILHPSFSEEEINRRRAVIKSSIIQQREDPGTVASKAFAKAVYGGHPYGRPVEGTEDSLDAISRQDIHDFHRTHYLPNRSVMAVVGDIDRDELEALLARHFRDWQRRDEVETTLQEPKFGEGPLVLKINRDITQANILLGHLGITRDNPDYYAVSVMNYILGGGGFASRLMDNIRDNKGLSYNVYSMFSANKVSGSFQVGLQTKNQSANTAIDEILREMKRIMTDPVSDKELADAKSYLTGSFPLRIDSNSKLAGLLIAIEYYNLGLNYIDDYRNFIQAVTKEDIVRVAGKYLNTENFVLVIVGNIEKAALRH